MATRSRTNHPFVEEAAGMNGGYPVVRNSRTPVRTVVEIFRQLDDFERTVAYFDHLTAQQVRAALDYYIVYPDRIDEDLKRNDLAWRHLTGQ
ncbi:MAG: DUF433 domain-containing protein [Chloroflexi bacterium]|nr:DUF433 domain-containing protein [Chloroflexota bacterium]